MLVRLYTPRCAVASRPPAPPAPRPRTPPPALLLPCPLRAMRCTLRLRCVEGLPARSGHASTPSARNTSGVCREQRGREVEEGAGALHHITPLFGLARFIARHCSMVSRTILHASECFMKPSRGRRPRSPTRPRQRRRSDTRSPACPRRSKPHAPPTATRETNPRDSRTPRRLPPAICAGTPQVIAPVQPRPSVSMGHPPASSDASKQPATLWRIPTPETSPPRFEASVSLIAAPTQTPANEPPRGRPSSSLHRARWRGVSPPRQPASRS